jgi:hypothetical protein
MSIRTTWPDRLRILIVGAAGGLRAEMLAEAAWLILVDERHGLVADLPPAPRVPTSCAPPEAPAPQPTARLFVRSTASTASTIARSLVCGLVDNRARCPRRQGEEIAFDA